MWVYKGFIYAKQCKVYVRISKTWIHSLMYLSSNYPTCMRKKVNEASGFVCLSVCQSVGLSVSPAKDFEMTGLNNFQNL